ncbi:P-loop containing nucleoside triphosphate hydrolase protein [Obelidium mucronatum]|nr:P-loop containing nucleoside triphosphate hydrolase protein [Obelidium mucronatum]
MDPFSEHTDNELWDALSRAGLKAKVAKSEGQLDAQVDSGGENLSVGERQLLCLSRAMLKSPKILIMDEATANVDYETDAMIQKALREDFKDATVLTIAHRLNTVIDYDRVMVLEKGSIAEFDSPKNLLNDESTMFSLLVAQTGESNAAMLKEMAA